MELGEAASDGAGQEHPLWCSSMQSSRTIIQVPLQGVIEGSPAVPQGIKEGQKHPNPPAHGKAQAKGPAEPVGVAPQPHGAVAARPPQKGVGGSRLPRSDGTPLHRHTGGVTLPWHRPEGHSYPGQPGHDGTPLLRPGGVPVTPDSRDTTGRPC